MYLAFGNTKGARSRYDSNGRLLLLHAAWAVGRNCGKVNNYFESKLEERIKGQHAKQVACEKKHPEFMRSSKEKIKADLLRAAPITARYLRVFIGLLLARAIAPNKEKHWCTTDEGAIPHSCFG
ncbi:hypothetical protein PHMEG_00037659 [Phytophthora megakarya]|uniref:Uncharacterized protein n=1 Tax=Phytophthora megakarya TaxID=4795 RepID=A0A225UKJ9_9STRA|nr:hypothetical protein PHMEG_00037659 [Phytophthora megakarya]